MSSKTKHLNRVAQAKSYASGAAPGYRLGANASAGKRYRPSYQARLGMVRWDRILLLLAAAVVGLLLGSAVWGAITTPRGTIAAAQTSYNFGDVPIGGGDITTRFPLTVDGDARAIDITST